MAAKSRTVTTTPDDDLDAATHRRILHFINAAVQPEDLIYEKVTVFGEGHIHEDGDGEEPRIQRQKLLDPEVARKIIEFRDREFPLGLRNLREIREAGLDALGFEFLSHYFSRVFFGEWEVFPQPLPRRGPGGYDGIVHAAMLRTGKVLFITADETTLLWDPEDTSPSTFEDPANQPHLMPGGYSQLCGHHVFLSDGRLLSVGGGGYGPHALAKWGYKFDPVAKSWSRTAGPMSDSRWYPTAVALGDEPGRVLVACGHGHGEMDIYDETTDDFTPVTGDTKTFPELYPGMHLLPNHVILYSRTGWGSAGAGGGPHTSASDDQSAYFTLTGTDSGIWNDIAPASPAMPDRTKGMSILLLSKSSPYVRVLVLGGADISTNHTYEIIDVTSLSPASDWDPPVAFPDGQHRSLASGVLLPDGNLFVCGGIQQTNSPCAIFNQDTDSWSPMAALPLIRDYHSAALLLPSGKVMMAGWNNTSIEIYSPPYLFKGPRPVITDAPELVHHGQEFVVEMSPPEGKSIVKVVLVRPMAVTHQTDSEQKVLELDWAPNHDHAHPKKLRLRAPHGGHPHSLAQRGYYMMFAVNDKGVPSVARWIYLH
jgi:hypothetical protein